MIDPQQALARLVAGNERFRTGTGRVALLRPELADIDQRPFAIVVGCSDSRTPVEILFDQGFGDLFVVRNAGNVASPVVFGSVEFAVETLGVTLIVVLGHTRCGAIDATLKCEMAGAPPKSKHIAFITDLIAPSVRPLLAANPGRAREVLRTPAMHANVLASVQALRTESSLCAGLIAQGKLQVVGAEYALETGAVTFLSRPLI